MLKIFVTQIGIINTLRPFGIMQCFSNRTELRWSRKWNIPVHWLFQKQEDHQVGHYIRSQYDVLVAVWLSNTSSGNNHFISEQWVTIANAVSQVEDLFCVCLQQLKSDRNLADCGRIVDHHRHLLCHQHRTHESNARAEIKSNLKLLNFLQSIQNRPTSFSSQNSQK